MLTERQSRRNWVRLDARCKQYLKKYLEGQHSRQGQNFSLIMKLRKYLNVKLQIVLGSKLEDRDDRPRLFQYYI